MKIYTSFHAKAKQLVEMGITPISISVIFPWYSSIKYDQYLSLAPRRKMLKMSPELYDIEFQKILGRLNPVIVHKDLVTLSQGKDIALLCYEKDVNDCHRKQVAEWIFKKLQIKVEEITFKAKEKPIKKKITNQVNLF